MSTEENNKRIAKNTIMLYLRFFLTTLVGLYTSRVVLQTLGVEDYGIYGIVGGVVAMMGFLNASMGSATLRFITFELGRGDKERLAKTFSSAMIVHVIIALIVFVLAETVGLWFLCNKLVIPEHRMFAAQWVYQLSIFSAMLSITQVPYSSTIAAHEKFDIYAYMEILNVTLKLLIVYLLVIGNFDKLILYAVLIVAVSAFMIMINRIYCYRHYQESHFHWIWDKSYIKPLLSFSGWNLYNSACVTAKQEGTNFLINMFYGVVYNAASSVATTVFGMLQAIAYNIIIAFNPQVTKKYSVGDMESVNILLTNSIKYSLLLFSLVAVPLCIEMHNVLTLWLGIVPEYADIFCKLLIMTQVFGLMGNSIFNLIQATGEIKNTSTIVGTFYLLVLPFTYITFKFASNFPEAPYVIGLLLNICVWSAYLKLVKQKVPAVQIHNILIVVLKVTFVALLSALIPLYLHHTNDASFLRLCVVCFSFVVIYSSLTLFVMFNKQTRQELFIKIKERISSFKS